MVKWSPFNLDFISEAPPGYYLCEGHGVTHFGLAKWYLSCEIPA